MTMLKKHLNLAIRTDSVDELIGLFRGRPLKRLKSAAEIDKSKRPLKELTNINQIVEQDSSNYAETSVARAIRERGQRICRKCGKFGHYQKNCNK
ncbi:2350_t:CDS:2 [Funneliformis caledonium]|uniref:2350_t:CDS:1 n=1 Tax=Funneliformis caledonium TaxID=1117310 RepID=A0A9N9FS28_9GLOM|nr:2350_t:CDS:2 [Funneliformis caledonium]